MEALLERLDRLQEKQLCIIEKGGHRLQDMIDYWCAVRGEHALLYAAKQKGLSRIQCTLVPAQQVSSSKAKQAIEIQMALESLKRAGYDKEPWTLQDTSWERYSSPPYGCFKKGGAIAEVTFDDEADNVVWHTVWDFVYYPEEESWKKTPGRVDGNGIYITQGDARTYFVDFTHDASKFSKKGTWTVNFRGEKMIGFSVVSSTDDAPDGVGTRPTEDPPAACPGSAASLPTESALPDSSTHLSSNRPDCGHHSGGSRSDRHSPYKVPAAKRRELRFPPSERGSCSIPPRVAEIPSSKETQPVLRGVSSAHRADAEEPQPSPAVALPTVENPVAPILLLSGRCNTVKCLRHRFKTRHRSKYHHITTTWYFAGETGNEREGEANIMMTFVSLQQREDFLQTVSIPTGVHVSAFTLSA
ncbi:MAG: early protein 2 [Equus asinus papillomavirus 3]|nr:MAG: early protein 2 [Equus asinus papillomavirus 3]